MPEIKFYNREPIPMEMHKVKIVQKLNLLPAKERLQKMEEAGYNTFLLHNGDIFMDMLTDSGVNAMSDNMQAAMLRADDAYAGSETFYRMNDKLEEIFGIKYLLPAHQGRACEHIIAQHFVKPGNCVIMNYHFTTSKAHVTRLGGHVEELVKDEARELVSHIPSHEYPAGSLVAALYLCGGIRGMERGTLSEERNPDGTEHIASVEMVRLAFPRRVFTLSQTEYVIDRVKWLYDHRELIGGLRFVHEPKTLRFFTGRLEPVSDWPKKLIAAYIEQFGEDQ